jgi:pseudouridine kinase
MLSGPDGVHFVDAIAADAIDVTGAGDSLLAAFCHALLGGADPVDAVRFGHAAATLTVASHYTVRPDLTERLVEATLAEAGFAAHVNSRRPRKIASTKEKIA